MNELKKNSLNNFNMNSDGFLKRKPLNTIAMTKIDLPKKVKTIDFEPQMTQKIKPSFSDIREPLKNLEIYKLNEQDGEPTGEFLTFPQLRRQLMKLSTIEEAYDKYLVANENGEFIGRFIKEGEKIKYFNRITPRVKEIIQKQRKQEKIDLALSQEIEEGIFEEDEEKYIEQLINKLNDEEDKDILENIYEEKEEKYIDDLVIKKNETKKPQKEGRRTVEIKFWAKDKSKKKAQTKQITKDIRFFNDDGTFEVIEKKTENYQIAWHIRFNLKVNEINTYHLEEAIGREIEQFHPIEHKYFHIDQIIEILHNDIETMIYPSTWSFMEIVSIGSVMVPNENGYDIKRLKLREFVEDKLQNKYINYETNENATTFKELFVNKSISQMVSPQFRPDCCSLNAFLEVYGEAINKFATHPNPRERRWVDFKPTIEYLFRICKPTEEFPLIGAIPMSLEDMIPLFKKFSVAVRVIDIQQNLLLTFPNQEITYIITKKLKSFNVLVHNKHLYVLNHNIKSLEQQAHKKQSLHPVTSNYKIQQRFEYNLFANNIDELISKIISCKMFKDTSKTFKKITIAYTQSLEELFYHLKVECKYEPHLNFRGNVLKSMLFKLNEKIIHIVSPQESDDDRIINFDSKKYFDNYLNYDNMVYTNVINKNTKSQYSKNLLEMFRQLPRNQLVCSFVDFEKERFEPYYSYTEQDLPEPELMSKKSSIPQIKTIDPAVKKIEHMDTYDSEKFYSIDVSKAYTFNICEMKYLPVFNTEDDFIPYDEHELDDYNFYIVKVSFNNSHSKGDLIYFNKKIERVTGFTLRRYTGALTYKILSYARPSKLVENNIKSIVEKVYLSNLCIKDKKFIVNKVIGLLGKNKNTRETTQIFTNYNEAYNSSKDVIELTIKDFKFYLASQKQQETLKNGFIPIRDFVYDIQRYVMFNLYNVFKHCELVGMNTDGLYSRIRPDISPSTEFFGIGSVKVEDEKKFCPQNLLLWYDNSEDIKFNGMKYEHSLKQQDILNMTLKNEKFWKTDRQAYENEFKDIMNKYGKIFINGQAGTGKSSLAKSYDSKVLCVCPTNSLAGNFKDQGYKAITYYNLLGLIFREDGDSQKTPFDVSEYKTIFLDEYYMLNVKTKTRIAEFMEKNKDKKYIVAGDPNQLSPIDDELDNIENKDKYYQQIKDKYFPFQITLLINKRLKNEDQKERLLNLENELKKDVNVNDVFKKFFKPINNIKQCENMYNIAYRNDVCTYVDRAIHPIISQNIKKYSTIEEIKYYEGLELICRKQLKIKKSRIVQSIDNENEVINHKLFVNNVYTISKINEKEKTMELFEPLDKLYYTIEYYHLKYFKLPYSGTCHRAQGLTIKQKTCIFDMDFIFSDIKWLYTAFTRGDDLDEIYYYTGEIDVSNIKYERKIKSCVESYKWQDKKANREYNENDYIDMKWIKSKLSDLKGICKYCKRDICNEEFSVNRIDNRLPHHKNNCEVCCVNCNKRLH